MNKSLYVIIALIVAVSGLIGSTIFGRSTPSVHAAGDKHTDTQHAESVLHDDTGKAPHDDSKLAPHN